MTTGEQWRKASPGQCAEIMGLAVDLRSQLDPVMLDRLLHGGLRDVGHVEAEDIIHQLMDFKERLCTS